MSCFTVAESTRSGAGRSSIARSTSEPGLAVPSNLPRIRTPGSEVPGGIARRRKECQLRAPAQWEADSKWFNQRLEEDGPVGLTSSNHVSSMYGQTLRGHGERIHSIKEILGGEHEA